MSDPESKRQDKFEITVRKILRLADENRNYVVGGVVALLLVAGAIYFKVVSGQRQEQSAWTGMTNAETTGVLRERWKKFGNTGAGIFLAEELAGKLYEEQREKAEKAEEDVTDERLALLSETVSVLTEALEHHGNHPFAPHVRRMLESVRAEHQWVTEHGKSLVSANKPVPKEYNPDPKKMEQAQDLEDEPGMLPLITLVTDRGEIVVELYEDDAPNHVNNLVSLIYEKFYDGLVFHRVEDWVVQTGCPDGSGSGGPGYRVQAEITKHKHERGAFGMARSQEMDSAGSQFYIVKKPQHGIDGQYTIFGRVLSGMDVADRLKKGDRLAEVRVDRIRRRQYVPLVIYEDGRPPKKD